ncbi:MAG: SRPBCC family protein [Gammaproteobacteria bacterium]|nr:SRPBCC family protein [Gammaproteobacteria bacterium]
MPSTYQSNLINAPVEKVWDAISNFHDLSWAPNVVNSCESVGDTPGTEVGAKRILNGAFQETLRAVDSTAHEMTYSIDDGPSPVSAKEVSNYIGVIKLTPVTMQDSTLIEWSSNWDSNEEDAAASFCHNIYVAILGDLAETMS